MRTPSDPVYLHHPDDPIWLETVIQPDSTRRVLVRRDNGDCRYLSATGCILPATIRPLICRIYPYDYNENGLVERLASGCPVQLLRNDETLLDSLGMQREEAERWHKQLYIEIREETHYSGVSRTKNSTPTP